MCCDDAYSLSTNFVTLNSYLCCELNAQGLVLLAIKLKDRPELFKPWKMSSQPCECFFRTSRSLSSMFSTQVNFTIKEFFTCRCKKVDVSSRLTAQGLHDGIDYPRERRAFDMDDSATTYEMPTLDEIGAAMIRARTDAEAELKTLGK